LNLLADHGAGFRHRLGGELERVLPLRPRPSQGRLFRRGQTTAEIDKR